MQRRTMIMFMPLLTVATMAGYVTSSSRSAAPVRATAAATSMTSTKAARELDLIAYPASLEFVSSAGVSTPYPTGPLAVGDRVFGEDILTSAGREVGADYELCSASFALHVLCTDTVTLTGEGTMQIAWMMQWPASGTQGPSSFEGSIEGGTGAYADAAGTFHATALPGHNLRIVAIVQDRLGGQES
jgi:hypothetical protein